MKDLRIFKKLELLLVPFAALTFMARHLLMMHWALVYKVKQSEKFIGIDETWQALAFYDHVLHSMFPVIGGTLLLVGAWLLFHSTLYVRLKTWRFDTKTFVYLIAFLSLVVSGIFTYYFFKLNVDFRYEHQNHQNIIDGLKVRSLFRKLLVVQGTGLVVIFFFLYEFFLEAFYFIHQKLSEEKEHFFQYISYFIFGTLHLFLILFALTVSLPGLLPGVVSKQWIVFAAFSVQIILLQHFISVKFFPLLRVPLAREFKVNINPLPFLILLTTGAIFLSIVIQGHLYLGPRSLGIPMVISLLGAISLAYLRKTVAKEKTILQTKVFGKTAELAALRAQINPHFLFNALNSLYAISLKENGVKTAEGIQKLGDIMRFMLHEQNQDRILLDKEIEYLKNYIEIQRMRVEGSDDIEIRVNIQQPEKEIYIAPMLLSPFVENAFKYGISLREKSFIYITLTMDATKLYFKVHNSMHPEQPTDLEKGQGLGLENVMRRLELIYPNRYKFDVQKSSRDYFTSLTINYY